MLMRQITLMPFARHQKLARHYAGSLVDQLVERVLAIGAGLAPDHGARLHRQVGAIDRHALAVALHFQLLQIGRQPRQALVIGQHRAAGMARNLRVPDADQGQHDRHIRQWRRALEMVIHRPRPGQKLVKLFGSNGDHQGKANRPPKGIAPTNPILKAKNARWINAIGGGLVSRGGDSGELAVGQCHLSRHPRLGRVGIGHGFDCGKGLGGDDDQRRLGVQTFQRIRDMRAIDVRDEVHARSVVIRCQHQHRHGRTEVRSADANIHNIGDPPALPAHPALPHIFGKGRHPCPCCTHARHHIGPVHHDDRIVTRPQRHMQHRPAFGVVDLFPGKHRRAPLGHA